MQLIGCLVPKEKMYTETIKKVYCRCVGEVNDSEIPSDWEVCPKCTNELVRWEEPLSPYFEAEDWRHPRLIIMAARPKKARTEDFVLAMSDFFVVGLCAINGTFTDSAAKDDYTDLDLQFSSLEDISNTVKVVTELLTKDGWFDPATLGLYSFEWIAY